MSINDKSTETEGTSVVSWNLDGSGKGLETGVRETSGDENAVKLDYDEWLPRSINL